MKNPFVVLWAHGPAWVEGQTVRVQPYWDEHAAFMDRLFAEGMIVLGGPFVDDTGAMGIFEAESEQDLADLLARDPFVIHEVFTLSSLKQWRLFLDARRASR
ncbi:MAG TPA: YciI family protein [Ktedonobacteraceae bacterium]|nr:YciI family protein [Ktedonobacteraceae bacterium]